MTQTTAHYGTLPWDHNVNETKTLKACTLSMPSQQQADSIQTKHKSSQQQADSANQVNTVNSQLTVTQDSNVK